MNKRITGALLGSAMLVSLTACGLGDKATEPWQDAPRSGSNNGSAEVVTMPDGFNNVATKCDNGNRVYTTFHSNDPYGAVAVVAQDPTCK